MPLTSPGNDDDTGENHQPTLRKNTAEPVEQTLKQNNLASHLSSIASRRLIATPSMHSHRDNPQWWSLPVGHIGRIKAQKTAARWARARTLDGRTVKFSAVAFPIRDSDKNLWGVAISYDPADQPATEPHEPTADHPTFDTGH